MRDVVCVCVCVCEREMCVCERCVCVCVCVCVRVCVCCVCSNPTLFLCVAGHRRRVRGMGYSSYLCEDQSFLNTFTNSVTLSAIVV